MKMSPSQQILSRLSKKKGWKIQIPKSGMNEGASLLIKKEKIKIIRKE